MHRKGFVLCCYALIIVVASLESQRNLTRWQYNSRENITGNNNEEQYKFDRTYEDNNTECLVNNTCIQLCCPLGDRLIKGKCVPEQGTKNYSLPIVYGYNSSNTNNSLDEIFELIVHDPCQERSRILFNSTGYMTDESNKLEFLSNGSVHYSNPMGSMLIKPAEYCLVIVDDRIKYDIIICRRISTISMVITVALVASIPFLLVTFLVYSILPELQNMHGYTLRGHVASLFATYMLFAIKRQTTLYQTGYITCYILALLLTFFFSATFFWLNVMCFDIWWIFRQKTRSSQQTAKGGERKKLILYALYGWGCPFALVIVCIIMDYVASVPKSFVRPEICIHYVWFSDGMAKTYYFYIPVGITIACNLYLFVSTARTITRRKKDMDQQLKSSENRRQNDNKQWFKMYLKLFILMGVLWVMEVLAIHSWAYKNLPEYIWYPTDVINSSQGIIIFFIFVWKRKIGLSLIKRLGYENGFFHRYFTNKSSSSNAQIPGSGAVSLESIDPLAQANSSTKTSSDEIAI